MFNRQISEVNEEGVKKVKEKATRTICELKEEKRLKEVESNKKIAALLSELQIKEQTDQTNTAYIEILRKELNEREENHRLYIQEVENYQTDLENRLQQKSDLVIDLFKNWFTVMGKQVAVLMPNGDKKDSGNKKLRKEITIWQEKYFEGKKASREVEKLVDAYNDKAMFHFRNEMKYSDETDYLRVCYFFAGFPIHLIACLLNENEYTVYQKRHRLRKNIEDSSLLHKDLFLRLLAK